MREPDVGPRDREAVRPWQPEARKMRPPFESYVCLLFLFACFTSMSASCYLLAAARCLLFLRKRDGKGGGEEVRFFDDGAEALGLSRAEGAPGPSSAGNGSGGLTVLSSFPNAFCVSRRAPLRAGGPELRATENPL